MVLAWMARLCNPEGGAGNPHEKHEEKAKSQEGMGRGSKKTSSGCASDARSNRREQPED